MLKEKQWKTKFTKEKKKEEDVTISIGLMEWREAEMKLKLMYDHDASLEKVEFRCNQIYGWSSKLW